MRWLVPERWFRIICAFLVTLGAKTMRMRTALSTVRLCGCPSKVTEKTCLDCDLRTQTSSKWGPSDPLQSNESGRDDCVFLRPAVHASVQDGCLFLCAEVSFEPFEQYDDYSACFGAQICALSRNQQRHDLFFRMT